MAKARVLFVDDEPNIRLTLPAILDMHGFEAVAAATVSEALKFIHDGKFDVLIADLNIGQPGDGFTVVSAMRRTQPDALTIIITGYPAFETALQAIREQVDDYVVKPADVDRLVHLIESKLTDRTPHRPLPIKRIASILRENAAEIIKEFLTRCHAEPELAAIQISPDERTDHIPDLLSEMVHRLEEGRSIVSPQALKAAQQHGRTRKKQGYTTPLLYQEGRLLRRSIYDAVQNNLLSIDLSTLIQDMIEVSDTLDSQLTESAKEFLTPGNKPKAA